MTELAPGQRTALRLVYFERLSHKQAAKRMELSSDAFAAQLSAAMRALASAVLPAGRTDVTRTVPP